jgi:hypothetical protein
MVFDPPPEYASTTNQKSFNEKEKTICQTEGVQYSSNDKLVK